MQIKFLSKATIISAAILGSLIVAPVIFAQDTTSTLTPPIGSVSTDIKAESLPQLAINLLFYVAIFLAICYLMYGGIRWITSRGDKTAVESARKHIIAAVMGIVVVAGSFFILQFIFTILGADNPLKKGFQLPTLKNVETK